MGSVGKTNEARFKVNAPTLQSVQNSVARPLNTPKTLRVNTVGRLMRGPTLDGFILTREDGATR